ncbi:hypothetical protein PVAND_006980 [Polypedilum vanderplanki]|uniref:Uncharacterized protein n=1 Tax=Polypedilum vanderplanki TaxID=319348 RepID=A0A9J6C4Z7_POLVA|nr:hypothetical protein PVAND_006980 [Polypedilum vanderplanki]
MKFLLVFFVIVSIIFIENTLAALHPSCITSRDVFDFETAQKECLEDNFYPIKECPGKYKCFAKEGEECVFNKSIMANRRHCKETFVCDFITPNSNAIVCRSYLNENKKSIDTYKSLQKKAFFKYIINKMKPYNEHMYDTRDESEEDYIGFKNNNVFNL